MVFVCWARRLLSCWFSSKSDIGENSNAYLICAVCVEERNGLNPAVLYDVANIRFRPEAVALTKGGRLLFAAECAHLRYRGLAGAELLSENRLSKC
jgi:hypothetical protein